MEFLAEVVATQSAKTHIHIIADNLSTHKTAAVQGFLSAHPNVKLHYTPTYSSWLNQVEIWFSKIQRDLIARGISNPRPTSTAKSCAISAITIRQLSPSSGLTKTQTEESDKPFTFICYTALVTLNGPIFGREAIEKHYAEDLSKDSVQARIPPLQMTIHLTS